MKIIRVEPTPSPNSMKLTLDTRLNAGVRLEYTRSADMSAAPSHIRKLLAVPGVTGVFQTADFIALERHPKGDWESILAEAEKVLGVAGGADRPEAAAPEKAEALQEPGYGELTVRVQTFRGIPMQIRVSSGLEEKRVALPERFQKAAVEAGLGSPNLIMERKLEERGIRYGDMSEVAEEIARELEAVFDDARLRRLVDASLASSGDNVSREKTESAAGPGTDPATSPATDAGIESVTDTTSTTTDPAVLLADPDWRVRYAAVDRLEPVAENLAYLQLALKDSHVSVRRLAVVYTGEIKEPEALPLLLEALQDRSPVIRRTAGDSLSDRGDPVAIPAMEEALADSSKLVRWRAARFLYEVGNESSLTALRQAAEDSEFEIRLQVRLAMERIENGEEAQGTVWQQMMKGV